MSYQERCPYDAPPPYYVEPAPTIIVQTVGDCPACHMGFLRSEMTALGIICCILFFPLGIICLFLLQEERCSACGYTVS